MITRRKLNLWLVVISFLPLLFGGTAGAQPSAAKSKVAPPSFQVKVSRGTLSVTADEAPLAKVLEEIGKQAGIVVEGNIGSAEKISIRLVDVPLEEGLKRLANNITLHYAQNPGEKTRRIAKIVVLSEDKRKGTRSESAKAEKPSKAVEQAQPPEPFTFEFDPTKSMKK
jgi:hypothetical protein